MIDDAAGLTACQRQWLDRIRECDRSGQTMKTYAEARGIPVTTLYSWKKKLVRKGVLPGGSRRFERIEVTGVPRSSAEWRLVLPNGVEVSWTGLVDEPSLATVLKATLDIA